MKNPINIRLCLDLTDLNKAIQRDFFLVPIFEEIKTKLLNKRYYKVLDIKQGFWHIKLDSKSTDLCTYSTPYGYYKFNRLPPFRLSCAPEAVIKLNQKYFGKIDSNNIVIYFDDILIATNNEDEHDSLLQKVIYVAIKLNIK